MENGQRHFVIGMAGHIDHGKTALVKALTGVDTDRLKEEKARGITIDLGFAHLSQNVTLIDVPGHERLIKNMVAGVSTIDLVLFVIAADDGVMPQTREHLDIVQLLGIRHGVFVITKSDLADAEWMTLIEQDIRILLQPTPFCNAPIISTSIRNGAGIEHLKQAIQKALSEIRERRDDGIFRLPVDRVFSKTGFGSIITGSVISGRMRVGETLEILPEKFTARIRGLHSHNHSVDQVAPGFRAAVNLAGVEMEQLYRGQVLVSPGYYQPVERLNCRLFILPNSPTILKNSRRIRIHLHTTEVMGRVILLKSKEITAGEQGYAQIVLERKIYASHNDRFIIRQYSPQITIGGGVILETNPVHHRNRHLAVISKRLADLEGEQEENKILACFSTIRLMPQTVTNLQVYTGFSAEVLSSRLSELESGGQLFRNRISKVDYYLSREQVDQVMDDIGKVLEKFHQKFPGRAGMSLPELSSRLKKSYPEEFIKMVLTIGQAQKILRIDGELVAQERFQSQLSDPEQEQLQKIEEIIRSGGFSPPAPAEIMADLRVKEKNFREYLNILRQKERLILVEDKLWLHVDTFNHLIQQLAVFFRDNRELKVTDFKALTGTTRKNAIPLLTYLDDAGITVRDGDVRIPGPRLEKK